MTKLSTAIKTKRESEGLNLRQLADITDVSAATLSRIENGKRPDPETRAKLRKWLGFTNLNKEWFEQQIEDLEAGRYEKVKESMRLGIYVLEIGV